jgi:hypothetical protein
MSRAGGDDYFILLAPVANPNPRGKKSKTSATVRQEIQHSRRSGKR